MPVPRAAGARRASSRLSTAESDDDKYSSPGSAGVSRPKLPQLAATPASRRQYTYGSAVEPPPLRPGRGTEPHDLSHAVGQALSRQQQEDKNSKRAQMPPPARPGTEEEDELSNAELAGKSGRHGE